MVLSRLHRRIVLRTAALARLFARVNGKFLLAYGNHRVQIKNCQYSGADRYRYAAYDSTDTSFDVDDLQEASCLARRTERAQGRR